jgi:hypothetical protein
MDFHEFQDFKAENSNKLKDFSAFADFRQLLDSSTPDLAGGAQRAKIAGWPRLLSSPGHVTEFCSITEWNPVNGRSMTSLGPCLPDQHFIVVK